MKKSYSLSRVAAEVVLRDAVSLATRGRTTDADLIAHIGEIGARKLYLPLAYKSLLAYCRAELGLTRDEALKRICVARVARRFPIIFEALADNRLHLTAVLMLKGFLSERSVERLIAAAAYKDKPEIQQLLAEMFPSFDVPAQVVKLPPAPRSEAGAGVVPEPLASVVVPEPPAASMPKVAPLSSETYAVQFTMSRAAHDQLRRAQELLSHQLPSGDIAQVMEKALDALVAQLEKRRFAATRKPRRSRPSSTPRHIPADVKRRVWERDGGQCTFVSESGRRCASRERLEFDHAVEVARGGESTVENVRLRCQAHHQYTAEQTFGAEFMESKRREVRVAARETQEAQGNDVVPWLRALGIRADDARRAAEHCQSIPEATLEERVRMALTFCVPRGTTYCPAC